MEISEKEKIYLLRLARHTIKKYFTNGMNEFPPEDFPILNKQCGAFVTITINQRLRGCIGYIISDKPILQTIKDAAVQAAFYDPRFTPLTEKEFDKIHIEISILSEPFPMNNYDEIILGKHGLIVNEHGHRGLLLPQVPVEHNMNKEEFLCAICQKAGLPQLYWQNKTLNMDLFTATVFSEKEVLDE